jgi:hypothetical protein
LAQNAALRRAVAKFLGLLSGGRNRKYAWCWTPAGRLDLAGETALMINRLIVPLTLAVLAASAGPVLAQGAFPAPLPGQASRAPDPAFPPVNGSAPQASVGTAPSASSPFPSAGVAPLAGGGGAFSPAPPTQQGGGGAQAQACMNGFVPLREDAEKKGKLIKAAGEKHEGPDIACKLIVNYSAAEAKMIKYVETNAAKCGIPPQVADQLKAGHKNTEAMQTKVCGIAQQMQNRGPVGPTLSDVLGSASSAPEAMPTRKGGSTFDTLNGNVLQR